MLTRMSGRGDEIILEQAEQVVAAGEIGAVVGGKFAGAVGRVRGGVLKGFHACVTDGWNFAERGQNFRRRDGQAADAHADGVGDGVGDGGGGRDRGRLADADDAAFGHVDQDDFDVRHVGDAGQFVGFKIRVQHHAGQIVHHALLVKRVAHAHDDAAVDLAFERELVNDEAAIVDADDFFHRDQTGFGVHVDFGELHAVGRAWWKAPRSSRRGRRAD